jgi:8-amino-7-oxononanoate synthase
MSTDANGSPASAGATAGSSGPTDGSTILQRAEMHAARLESLLPAGTSPLSAIVDDISSAVEAVVNGRKTLLFGTNSYLGLNFHPECIAAASAALHSHGTGSTASRVASGNSRDHVALEADIAAFYGRRHCVVYSTGFLANLGVITALAKRGDNIFLDAHCHASIIDACRLSGARFRLFRHNDPAHLERLMSRTKSRPGRTIVIAEGVYSVCGDIADLTSILSIAKAHGALTIVDEAHGFGIFGERGRGVSEALGVEHNVDIIVGTLSKSAGVIGGYSVTNLDALASLRIMARSYLYTASLPPAVVAAARTALRLIATDASLRKKVWANAALMRAALECAGLPVAASSSTIGSIPLSDFRTGTAFWQKLLARGIYANALFPPATPDHRPVIRFSVSASHTVEHIETAVAAFAEVWRWHLSENGEKEPAARPASKMDHIDPSHIERSRAIDAAIASHEIGA